MNLSPSPDAGQTPEPPAPDETASFANFWQGSIEELEQLEKSLREVDVDQPPGQLAPCGRWLNPLEGLEDDKAAEEMFLKVFIDDTLLTLDDLIELLLALEGGGTTDEIEKLVAIFHRVKGSAAMVGLRRAAKLAHCMEDVLQDLLESAGILSSELTDAVLKGSDALRVYVENLRGGVGGPDTLQEAAQEMHFACQPRTAGQRQAASLPASKPGEALEIGPAATPANGHDLRSAPSENLPRGETLRVEIGHLDRLMGLAGQLTIQNARFHSIMGKFRDDPDDRFRELFEAVHHLDRISDGIRRGVMDVRMVPIGPLLNRYHRVARDLTRASGKAARLVIRGEKTELDKRMIDELSDPLLQIVRNALDHGIEDRGVREASGKPAEGLLTIHAFHRGNSILIQISDDGAGLDLARVLQKSVEKGIVTKAEADAMTPSQIQALIWKPGMSTAQQVTEVSGRGVGMDIVRSKIEGLHGSVEVQSVPGWGTTFSIRLPLTLAILPCLMIVANGETFAVPMEVVREIVALDDQALLHVQGGTMVRIRQRVLATTRLDEALSWSQAGRQNLSATGSSERVEVEAGKADGAKGHIDRASAAPQGRPEPTTLTSMVIVGERGHDVGLMVDRVLGQQDVVIQSLSENYRDVPGIAGATILGDGRVALILDIAPLLGRSPARSLGK